MAAHQESNQELTRDSAPDATPESTQVRLGPQGRLVIPAGLRRQLGFEEGEALVARIEGGRLVLEKPSQVLARLKARFQRLPEGVSLAAELIEDRRLEVRQEG